MPRKPKLTPTTNDALQNGSGLQVAGIMPIPMPPPFVPPFILPPDAPVDASVPQVASAPIIQPLKIALIGTAPSSKMLAPYNDPSWKIWACSPGNMNTIPRFDAWFEIHGTNLLWPENQSYAAQYIQWMKDLKVPLYMQDQQLAQNAIPVPKDQLVEEFGPYFFTSSFAWMMAMGIMAGASEIAMYGIDMASREEYIIQRPGAYWFICEGARRGCKIWAPYESDIMQPPPLYGWSDVGPLGRKLNARKSELTSRLTQMRQQRDDLIKNITYLEGALEDNDYSMSIQGGAQDNSNLSYLERLLSQAKPAPAVSPAPSVVQQSQG